MSVYGLRTYTQNGNLQIDSTKHQMLLVQKNTVTFTGKKTIVCDYPSAIVVFRSDEFVATVAEYGDNYDFYTEDAVTATLEVFFFMPSEFVGDYIPAPLQINSNFDIGIKLDKFILNGVLRVHQILVNPFGTQPTHKNVISRQLTSVKPAVGVSFVSLAADLNSYPQQIFAQAIKIVGNKAYFKYIKIFDDVSSQSFDSTWIDEYNESYNSDIVAISQRHPILVADVSGL